MVLVPAPTSKLFPQWQGPYEIIKAVGPVNYKVHQPGRCKEIQIYHINLLKPWVDYNAALEAHIEVNACSQAEETEGKDKHVNIGPDLDPQQTTQVNQLVAENRDVFSSLPGHTSAIQHDTETPPSVRVRVRPYCIPEAKKIDVDRELEKLDPVPGIVQK